MEGLTHICLPTLPCSFPLSKLHPLYEHLVEEMDNFCRHFTNSTVDEKTLDFIKAEKWPFLTCAFWPAAIDARLPWVTKFLCWFILLDTEADNIDTLGADGKKMASLMQKYIDVIRQGQGDGVATPTDDTTAENELDDMLLTCFTSLWDHFKCNMTPIQYARLSNRCLTFFNLLPHQSKLREEGTVLSPTQLLELRRVVSSGMIIMPLMEYAIGVDDLDECILNRPEIQEMEVASVDHMVTTNDILSFRKEYLNGDFNNLPSSFCLSKGVDFQTAVDLTSKLVHDMDHRFCELHAAVSKASYFTPQVKLFIDGLGYMMSGNLEWSWHTARYHGLHWVAPPAKARQGIMYLEDPPRFESGEFPKTY